eukprot:scaffold297181_cov59-Attheya_sp.AAC.1
MAKTHSMHDAFSSRKSRRGNRPQRGWSMVNKVSVRKACHGWEDLDTVSGTVRPTRMDAIATTIIPQNRMSTNSREQIIAITATVSSSLGRKQKELGSLSKAIGSLKYILPNRSTAFKQSSFAFVVEYFWKCS